MKVFIVSPGYDTAGQAARIAGAFKRHAPDWSVRAMRLKRDFLHFPPDLEWDEERAIKLYDEADVVHHQNGLGMYVHLDKGQCKPTILHHHGTRLRRNPDDVYSEGNSVGATQLVSTVDLLDDCPRATWLPSPCNVREVSSYRVEGKRGQDNTAVRIGHAPTNRRAKNTSAILAILDSLSERCNIEIDLIEQVEWTACLSRKARCDIFIDQIALGYGNNAIEAMAMGIPVVSGWTNQQEREDFVQCSGTLPQFVEATLENLDAQLEPLIRSKELREEWGRRGRDYVDMFHAEERVVEQLKRIYSSTPPSSGTARIFKPGGIRV